MRQAFLAIALLLALPSTARADVDQDYVMADTADLRASQIEYVLKGDMAAEEVFSPSFLAEIPAAQLQSLAASLVAQNGRIVGVDRVEYKGNGAAVFDLMFEHGQGDASLQLAAEEPHLVSGFRISSVVPTDDTPQKILADFAALPGTAGFGVWRLTDEGLSPVLASKADVSLAIGSTFKLYVLSALVQQIKAGKRHWSDVVTLDARSVPSGQMQDWPKDAPVTLHTLATMMISISDNTATDTLMRLLGRDAIAREVIASGHSDPSRTLPMLTTIELFALKAGDPARIAAYAAADDAGQRNLLDQWAPDLARERVDLGKLIGSAPNAIDSVEWFASAEDVARILRRLRDTGDPAVLEILAVNPSVSQQEGAHWAYAGYKGGSEPGVLNLSWLLKDKEGHWFVISASWNDPAKDVDPGKLQLLAVRLFRMLRR